jgi:hypothetical protein
MSSLSYTSAAPVVPASKLRSIDVVAKRSKADEPTAFETLVDAINPMQQIPGVGQAYRKVSGDKTSNGAQLAGHVAIGAAIGGPIGAGIGAGIFVLEKALPGVFNAIGSLFSIGKNSDTKADMPKFSGVDDPKQGASAPRRPLIEGLDVRPGSKRAPQPRPESGASTMSSAQFDALMQSIGAQPISSSGAAANKNQDVAALIQRNLDQYRRQQNQTNSAAQR